MENKLKKLEQLFEMQEGTLRPDTLLKDLEEWGSITPFFFFCEDGKYLWEKGHKNRGYELQNSFRYS